VGAVLALTGAFVVAQPGLTDSERHAALREIVTLLSLPNVATNQADIRKNAEYVKAAFEKRGFSAAIITTRKSPVVMAERPPSEAAPASADRTITFYFHYDGQPVNPAEWKDSGPFEPIFRDGPIESGGRLVTLPASGSISRDWRIYARSSADDKGEIAALLSALDVVIASRQMVISTIRVILEGDEEAGSPVLEETLLAHADRARGDLVIMVDGPRHASGRPTFFFGARGILSAELTVFGAKADLHSGNYGNWAPNPALELSRLIASMKDENGRVLIKGFYDDVVPLTPDEERAIAEIPAVERDQMRSFGFARPELPGDRLERRHNLPTLNVEGLLSGTVGGQGRTIIPASATARFDLRLVKAIDPARQFNRLADHVRAQGYQLVAGTAPTDEERATYPKLAHLLQIEGYPAGRTRFDTPLAQAVIATVGRALNATPVRLPTLGGSAPFYVFTDRLKAPTIGMPVANYDNNQHGPNENLRLGEFFDAIEAMRAILTMK
jgi:acetylornithine deacetylase/succinyl-diaminopimelate desuccinylase-like protein